MLAVARCRPSMGGCWMWQIIPKHGYEAVRYFGTEAAVGWQALEHLHALLEQKLLVIERLPRRQCRNSFKCKFSVLHTHALEVFHDRGFLRTHHQLLSTLVFAEAARTSLFFSPLDASADLPSLDAVGFLLIVPINDRNALGMMENNS